MANKILLHLGAHPHHAEEFNAGRFQQLENLLKTNDLNITSVGEIGLDYSHKNFVDHNIQKQVFIQQVEMAKRYLMPLCLHMRDAYSDGLDILSNQISPFQSIHLHCFRNSFQVAEEWMSKFPNLKFGVTATVTRKNSEILQHTVKKLPLEKIILETDGPFFPVDRSIRDYSLPTDILSIAEAVGDLKNEPKEKMLKMNIENSKKIYFKFLKK